MAMLNLLDRQILPFPFALVSLLVIGTVRLALETLQAAEIKGKSHSSLGKKDPHSSSNISNHSFLVNSCNVFEGKWVFDNELRPMYDEESCPFLTKQVTCKKNGKSDSAYQNWRWKPDGCDLPRFDTKKLLGVLTNKRVMFIGDSLQRTQWESMVCLIQSYVPEGKKLIHRNPPMKIFKAEACFSGFYWAPFLVESNSDHAVKHTVHKRLVKLDSIAKHSQHWRGVDVLVFESYIWWMYKLLINATNNSPYNVTTAYKLALRTWANWIESFVNPHSQRVFFMSPSPTHLWVLDISLTNLYRFQVSQHNNERFFDCRSWEWRAGCDDNCFNEFYPIEESSYWGTGSNLDIMRTLGDVLQELKINVSLLNITQLSEYRKDAHTSVYTERRGKLLTSEQKSNPKTFADCIHWCLPGVPDTWNEILGIFSTMILTLFQLNKEKLTMLCKYVLFQIFRKCETYVHDLRGYPGVGVDAGNVGSDTVVVAGYVTVAICLCLRGLLVVEASSSCSLARPVYGLSGLRGIQVGFECSVGSRRLRVGYYIRPFSAGALKTGIEAFAEKSCWLLEFEQLTVAYWSSERGGNVVQSSLSLSSPPSVFLLHIGVLRGAVTLYSLLCHFLLLPLCFLKNIMDTTPNTRYQKRMGFSRDRRIGRKTPELKLKFFDDHELDWDMPDLVELELGEPINGELYAYLWGQMRWRFRNAEECYLYLSSLAKCHVQAEDQLVEEQGSTGGSDPGCERMYKGGRWFDIGDLSTARPRKWGLNAHTDKTVMSGNLERVLLGELHTSVPFSSRMFTSSSQSNKNIPNTKYQNRVAARVIRIREKILELKHRYFGDRGLDWAMPDLFEVKLGEPISGMPYSYWWGVLQMMGPILRDRLALLEFLAEEKVDKEDSEDGVCEERPVYEEIEEHEASVSGRAPMVEGSDVKELIIAADAPLAVVVSEIRVSGSKRQKVRVTEERDEEEMEGGEKVGHEGSVEPSGDEGEEREQSDHSEE
ncbi:hypothetical protein GIB67_030120 [Kingdonia uniflora]|uniref:Trichome birefringence-like N-terminal domain-containing protein n=1 Tax=Kingdonia uniflora TaxID=39325 RepID=A0A7J7L2J0_9MAGN|nr:hypothetical protein GIB67_030120 [Kingdonia uniflora]